MESVHLQLSEELLARIDAERGMVARNRWIRWAVEQALGDTEPRSRKLSVEDGPLDGRRSSSPAPAEQPEAWSRRTDYTMGARSSVQAKRGTGPRPKSGK